MKKLKFLILAALMAALILPVGAFAEEATEAPTEVTKATTVAVCEYPVKVINIADSEVIESLSMIFEIKNPLGIPDTIKVVKAQIEKDGEYKIVENIFGEAMIEISNEEAMIYVYPSTKEIQIIHHLFDCNGKIAAQFLETTEIDFLVDLDDETASEIAQTRIQKMNAKGYIFKEAEADVKPDLPKGVRVKTLDGEDVTPDPKMPTVHLYYIESDCIEEEPAQTTVEQKVDAANADYSLQQTLPATGEQDLVTFLLSASALLGLGIFFAKKH